MLHAPCTSQNKKLLVFLLLFWKSHLEGPSWRNWEVEIFFLPCKSQRKYACLCCVLSHVWLFATPWTVVHQSHVDCNPPGSSVQGIFQARILELVAISFSKGFSPPRDQTCIAGGFFGGSVVKNLLVMQEMWIQSLRHDFATKQHHKSQRKYTCVINISILEETTKIFFVRIKTPGVKTSQETEPI